MRTYLVPVAVSLAAAAVVGLVGGLMMGGPRSPATSSPTTSPPPPPQVVPLLVRGVTTEADADRVRQALQGLPGVAGVEVNPGPDGALVRVKPAPGATLDPQKLEAAARHSGFQAEAKPDGPAQPRPSGVRGSPELWAALSVAGVLDDASRERLRHALAALPDVDSVRFRPDVANERTIALVKGKHSRPDLAVLTRTALAAGFKAEAQSVEEMARRNRLANRPALDRLCAVEVKTKPDPATIKQLTELLSGVPGVQRAFVQPRGPEGPLYAAAFFGPDAKPDREAVLKKVRQAGFTAELVGPEAMQRVMSREGIVALTVEGVADETAGNHVQTALRGVAAVEDVRVFPGREEGRAVAIVRFRDGAKPQPQALVDALTKAGFQAKVRPMGGPGMRMGPRERRGDHQGYGGFGPPPSDD